ncbi:MAG TPA: hypothetical protein VIF57_13570 [Polyangia bacterium]|jgi:hypothetical protein
MLEPTKTVAATGALLLLTTAAAGCGHGVMRPGPQARVVSGEPLAAYSIVEGVRCSADVGAWRSKVDELPGDVVPVKVWIKNQSGHPIQLLAQDFEMLGKNGHSYRPIPVVALAGEGSAPRDIEPMYASSKFYVAPRLHGVYSSLEPWRAPLQRDEQLYDRQFKRWGKSRPTLQMIRMALPEGVLDDGGMISGFLYFESPLAESKVTFQADFGRDDGSGTVAAIEIPFRIE